ncbi:MAG: cation:proton antiporter [Planctomycetes bacterium]|nr:cation:proton antiporter [Planctomycetota bacterium]
MAQIIDIVLLVFLCTVAVATVRMRDLFGIAMLFGIFSLLSASVFVVLDAGDVAMTEAAVGAGLTTILMLSTLAATGSRAHPRAVRWKLPLFVVTVTGAALVYATTDMPRFGDPNAPVQTHPVAKHYIETSQEETGIPNMVTPLLASYRGFDTLGETAVVFTAGIGVLALIGRRRKKDGTPVDENHGEDIRAEHHAVVRVVGKILIPAILLYACYIQAHGDFGPGGGFQAGVVFASGLMLYLLLFGVAAAARVAPFAVLERLIALGLLLYGGIGVLNMMLGGNFLDYRTLAENAKDGLHYGIILIELGVGITVAAVVTTLVFAFADHLQRGPVHRQD